MTQEQLFAYVMLILLVAFFVSVLALRWEKKLVRNTEFEEGLEKKRLEELEDGEIT